MASNCLPTKYKGKNSNFTVESTLNKWSKWTSSEMGQIETVYYLTGCSENTESLL